MNILRMLGGTSALFAVLGLPLSASVQAVAQPKPSFQDTQAKAEAGDVNAQYILAGMYGKGDGVPKDDAQAVEWYRKVAEQGDARGQSMLGVMYTNARGVPRDYDEAMKWFRKAAAQKSLHAYYNLAHMYSTGKGVDRDLVEAANWQRKAAEQNYPVSQRGLSGMCASGQGIPKDLVLAHAWLTVADPLLSDATKQQLQQLEKQMTPEQIAAAAQAARDISAKLAK
jgi:TPR repeat protein